MKLGELPWTKLVIPLHAKWIFSTIFIAVGQVLQFDTKEAMLDR